MAMLLSASRGMAISPRPPSFLDFWHLDISYSSIATNTSTDQARWEKWESVEQAITAHPRASNSAALGVES